MTAVTAINRSVPDVPLPHPPLPRKIYTAAAQ